MAIDVKKINIVLPEGVTKQGEIALKGNEAELTVIGTTVGPKVISASYDGGVSKTVTLTVTEVTQFDKLTTEPANKVVCEGTVKLVAAFSRVPVLSEVSITHPLGFNETVAPAVVGHNIEATYTASNTPQLGAEFKVDYRSGTVVKTVSIDVEEKPAVLQNLTVSKGIVRLNETVRATFEFDKPPVLSKIELKPTAGLTQSVAPAVEGNNIVVSYTGNTAGTQNVIGVYEGVTKTASVEVVKDAVIKTATADPESVEVGGSSVITVEYDKAFVEGQAVLEVSPAEGINIKTPYAENLAKNGGTVEVTVTGEGAKNITLRLGGEEKVVTITGTAKPQVQAVDVDPSVIEKDGTAKVKVTMK